MERDVITWVVWLTKRRALLLSLVALLSSGVTLVGGAVALRAMGPRRDMEVVKGKVDSLRAVVDTTVKRVGYLSELVIQAKSERDTLSKRMDWIIYLECRSALKTEPGSYLPDICKNGIPK